MSVDAVFNALIILELAWQEQMGVYPLGEKPKEVTSDGAPVKAIILWRVSKISEETTLVCPRH
jgi:hypothetical protein